MKLAATAFSALLLLPLMANADTYTTFAVSGTDSQEQSITNLGVSGCAVLTCNNYAPGTFSGAATIDISTDTVVAATITTCCQPVGPTQFVFTFNTSSGSTPNFGSGLDLEVLSFGASQAPYLSLDFGLSSNTVSGFVSGVTEGVSGASGLGSDFTTDMVGTLTPEFTTPPTTAPEIDPASAASGLMLLLGSLLVLRGRRPPNRVTA